MTPPAFIGAMSSNREILDELLSSSARLRFPQSLSCCNHNSRSFRKSP